MINRVLNHKYNCLIGGVLLNITLLLLAKPIYDLDPTYFEEYCLFENMTIIITVMIGVYFYQKLRDKFGLTPLLFIFFACDRELGAIRYFFRSNGINDYKRYLDIVLTVVALYLLVKFIKKYFIYIRDLLLESSQYRSNIIWCFMFFIINSVVATVTEKYDMVWYEEIAELFVILFVFIAEISFKKMVFKEK